MDLGLAGKRAIVTGGSKGIGFATALRLAEEGASVAIVARRPEALEEARLAILARMSAAHVHLGPTIARGSGTSGAAAPGALARRQVAAAISADVSTAAGAERAVSQAVAALGGLDILVNNAGTAAAGPFASVDDDAWQRDLDLKVFGAIRMTRLALPYLRESKAGRVVNVTAIQGKQPGANTAPTSVSRAAGLALTKLLSKELAGDGITVNAVCIGLVRSEQIERGARARFPDLPLDDALKRMGQGIPLGRVGDAQEAGDVIAFLCSERASYVSGVAVNIDGGMSAVL